MVSSVNDSCELFTDKFMDFVKISIPHKDVTIRPTINLGTILKSADTLENVID